jgi:hypothetical protein
MTQPSDWQSLTKPVLGNLKKQENCIKKCSPDIREAFIVWRQENDSENYVEINSTEKHGHL